MIRPVISIITPSFNQGEYIEETICSILDQKYQHLEYIIIDGGSTDQTPEIIKKYSRHLKYWCTEKDKGQADAINKGLEHCTGDIFNWINSDDLLTPGTLELIGNLYDQNIDTIAGQVVQFEGDNKNMSIKGNRNISAENLILDPPEACFHQPGLWLPLQKMQTIGRFRTDMHYCFDHEYYIRFFNTFPNIHYVEDQLARFRLHHASKTVSCAQGFRDEQDFILEEIVNGKTRLSPELTKRAKSHLEWIKWKNDLKQAQGIGGVKSICKILYKMCLNPKRWNRYSLGTLRSMIVGK